MELLSFAWCLSAGVGLRELGLIPEDGSLQVGDLGPMGVGWTASESRSLERELDRERTKVADGSSGIGLCGAERGDASGWVLT